MCDKEDKDVIETALREANEEVGIKRDQLTILAQLCPVTASTNVIITPVLAFFNDEDFEPVLNKDEVDMIFELPTDRFIASEGHESKSVKFKGNDEYYVHSFEDHVGNEVIKTWGATANICMVVSTMLHSRAPNFVVDPKFEFKNNNVNEYMEFNFLRNVERIRQVDEARQKRSNK